VGVSGAAFAGVRTVVSRRSGRLGDRVFRDAALRVATGQRDPRLLRVDLDELAAAFDDVDARILSARRAWDRAELGHRGGVWWPPEIAASHLTFRSTARAA
jgi:hypothetical protein